MYIERETLLKMAAKLPEYDTPMVNVFAIKTFPAAEVAPVVRCSKCIFGCYYEESESWHCRSINGLYREVKENDFCSYGERRTKNVQETEKEIHEVSDPH